MACFGGNAVEETLHDVYYEYYVEKNDPKYVRRLIRVLKNTEDLPPMQESYLGGVAGGGGK
jgi:hypothetical protein